MQNVFKDSPEQFQKLCLSLNRDQFETFANAIPEVMEIIYNKTFKVFLPISVTDIELKNGDT